MQRVLVLGAGNIGAAIADLLSSSGDFLENHFGRHHDQG